MLTGMTGDPVAIGHVAAHWHELLRLTTSIRSGTATASAMLRRLSAYPRQNGLALALREVGRIERSIFMLDLLRDLDLRRRTQAGLNKGEARTVIAPGRMMACARVHERFSPRVRKTHFRVVTLILGADSHRLQTTARNRGSDRALNHEIGHLELLMKLDIEPDIEPDKKSA